MTGIMMTLMNSVSNSSPPSPPSSATLVLELDANGYTSGDWLVQTPFILY